MAFDRATSVRSWPHRHGATAALAVIIAAALAGCGGASIPAPGGGGGGGGGSAAGGGGPAVSNACSLLTATEIQNVVVHAVATSSPFQDQPGQPGCS